MNRPSPCTLLRRAKHIYSLQALKQADKWPDPVTPHQPSPGGHGDVRASPGILPTDLQPWEDGASQKPECLSETQKPCRLWHGSKCFQRYNLLLMSKALNYIGKVLLYRF